MGVEQHTPRTVTYAPDDSRLTSIDGQEFRLHACLSEEPHGLLGRFAHRLAREAGKGTGRDAHEALEIRLQLRHELTDGFTQGVDGAGAHATRLDGGYFFLRPLAAFAAALRSRAC